MKLTNDLEFGWKHVFAPTPRNVELGLKASRRILAAIGGSTFLASKSVIDSDYDWVMFWIVVIQVAMEEVAAFIGEVTKPEDKKRLVVEGPAEIIDQTVLREETIENGQIKDETKVEMDEHNQE
jgi:hypothetical protein